MKNYSLFLAAAISSASLTHADPSGQVAAPDPAGHLITYSNRPLGSPDEPLLLRTFMPDPGLGEDVLSHHHHASSSPKYNVKTGKDVKGEFEPIDGLPTAIGVNYGSKLSYCWDPVECRLLYVWDKGFLNMEPYWGDPERGSRQSYSYVPHLVGTLYFKAAGKDPLQINGTSVSDLPIPPKFIGYQQKQSRFIFEYQAGEAKILCEITDGDTESSLVIRYESTGGAELSYAEGLAGQEATKVSGSELLVTIQGTKIAEYTGNPDKDLLDGGINEVSGERIFEAMACATCHSTDGSKSHGPSLLGLHGSKLKIHGSAETTLADDAYILQSIKDPNAKIVVGYPENYMPPYTLKEDEYKALLIYIKSLKK